MGGYDANLELEKVVEIASNLATWSRRDATMSFLWGKQPIHTTTHGVATMMQPEAVETIQCSTCFSFTLPKYIFVFFPVVLVISQHCRCSDHSLSY